MPRLASPRRILRPPLVSVDPEQAARMASYVVRQRTFNLSRPQLAVFRCSKRFRVLVAGRRFGKTFLAVWELIRAALAKPGGVCWYVAPTYSMARDLAWYVLLHLLPAEYIATDRRGQPMIREGRLEVTLKNGSRIVLKGANNPRSLHGRGLWFVVLDEFADLDEDVLFEAVMPALGDHEGSLLAIGTPKGFNYAYKVYTRAVERREDGTPRFPEWASFSFRTIDGGRVKPHEVELARSNLSPAMFAQQYLASFTRLADRVYENFHAGDTSVHQQGKRHGNVDPNVADDPNKPLLVGMDFNVNPMSAVLGVRRMTARGAELHVFKEMELLTSNTEQLAEEIRRYASTFGERRPVIVCPDASGTARQSSAGIGVTNFTILQRHGFAIEAPSRNPELLDRFAATNALCLAGDHKRRLKVSPGCTSLVAALTGYTYQKNTSIPEKKGGLDHITDALGYLVWSQFNDFVPTWEEGSYR